MHRSSDAVDDRRVIPFETDLAFQRDGFAIVRDVFSQSEVERLRRGVAEFVSAAKTRGHVLKSAAEETVPVGDLLGRKDLDWVLSDSRIVAIARRFVGRDDLVYFGDSGVMLGGTGRGFHKDNTVRDDATHADWRTPYTLIRMGIYLQDHEHHSGGLKVRRSSHLFADVTSGDIVDVPTHAGDVVVWSLRTTHSGHALRVRGFPFLRLAPRFEARLPAALRKPEDGTRHAIFATFGANDGHLRNYLRKHTDLESYPENYMYKSWLFSDGSEDAVRKLSAAGITMVKPIADYGSMFGSTQVFPEGFVPTQRGRPDNYPVDKFERLVRFAGRVLRDLKFVDRTVPNRKPITSSSARQER